MRVVHVEVSETERELLRTLVKKGSDWRERAETILLLAERHTPDELEAVIDKIGEEFGDLYTLTFC